MRLRTKPGAFDWGSDATEVELNPDYIMAAWPETGEVWYQRGVDGIGVLKLDAIDFEKVVRWIQGKEGATLGRGTCEMVVSGAECEGNADRACTACGAYNIFSEYYDGEGHRASLRYCPNCGREVKGEP